MIGGGVQDPPGQEGVGRWRSPLWQLEGEVKIHLGRKGFGRGVEPPLVIRGGVQDPPGQKGMEGGGAPSGD